VTGLLLLLAVSSHAAVADAFECTRAMYVVAHEDDSLLFQSPALLGDIRSGRCVRTVFLTAGDAGMAESFWRAREQGAEAAYAQMAGLADAWTESTEVANGHPIALATLTEDPRVSLLFMRLPDGGYPAGLGTPLYGNQSLMQLWNGGNGATPAESAIAPVDGSTPTYDYQGLIDTLADLMISFEPRWIATQNYTGEFPVGAEEPVDHPDHVATAKFVREAQGEYAASHRLIGYEDYETAEEAENVFGPPLDEKVEAFAAYLQHDESCEKGASCEELYEEWLQRQYVAASETHGVVANAGYSQTVNAGEAVSLDGSLSSAEGGGSLGYEWTQVAGPPVELKGAATAHPSFVAPPAEASLSFALTVSNGVEIDADAVPIAVEGPDPTPTAVTRAAPAVEPGALVTLDGSGSVNPYLQPLGYEWTQVAGPPVELSGAATAAPSFVAPGGPASLEFSLVVSNEAAHSTPVSVTIAVLPPRSSGDQPPASTGQRPVGGAPAPVPKLSRNRIALVIPRRGRIRKVVSVRGDVGRGLWCTGRLPRGARCREYGWRKVAVEATSTVRGAGLYRLHVHVVTETGTVTQTLAVRLVRRSRS
jgi:LmbE family N-acetylglucosaminyl deacetylase